MELITLDFEPEITKSSDDTHLIIKIYPETSIEGLEKRIKKLLKNGMATKHRPAYKGYVKGRVLNKLINEYGLPLDIIDTEFLNKNLKSQAEVMERDIKRLKFRYLRQS